MKKIVSIALLLFAGALLCSPVFAQQTGKKAIYQLTIYKFKNTDQEKRIDDYLSQALLPALHRMGRSSIGVFKPITNDTAVEKSVYVLTNHASIQAAFQIRQQLAKDKLYQAAALSFESAPHNDPAFSRVENILMEAFRFARQLSQPALTGPRADRIYELRSYESATEKLYQSKVHMFNEGGEIPLFKRLGFNAVFYGEVLYGSRMPNFYYMTSFNNLEDRNQHWKVFGDDPEWKAMLAKPEYKNNVSKADIILTRATPYSDL